MKSAVHFTFSRGETMIRKTLVNVGVAALLGGMALVSQAATMNLNAWAYGNGNAVSSAPPVPGGAGSFKGTLSGASGPFSGINGVLNIQTYCVEIGEFFYWNTPHPNYNVVESESYFSGGKALQLAKLLSYANPIVNAPAAALNGTDDDLSTSLQLAIWNIVYDTDMTVTPPSSGSAGFSDTSSFAAKANEFLLNSVSQTNYLQLFVLKSQDGVPVGNDGRQDQMIWLEGGVPGGGNIPEPTSLALAFGALGALGFATRRRQTVKT